MFIILFCVALLSVGAESANVTNVQMKTYNQIPEKYLHEANTEPFIKIGQKYYFIEHDLSSTWFEAAQKCRQMNADLAEIESAEEFKKLFDYFTLNPKEDGSLANYWFSGNDLGNEGQFMSLNNGKKMSFFKWNAGDPNNHNKEEHCLEIFIDLDDYTMNDRNCKHKLGFICQTRPPRLFLAAIL